MKQKTEEQVEKEALQKLKEFLIKKDFTPVQRFWLKKNMPEVYYLKYNIVDEYKPCKSEDNYTLCSQDVKDFIDQFGDLYPNYKVKELTPLGLYLNNLKSL